MKREIKGSHELMRLIEGLKLKEHKTFYLDKEKYIISKEGEKEDGTKKNIK